MRRDVITDAVRPPLRSASVMAATRAPSASTRMVCYWGRGEGRYSSGEW